MTAWRDLNRRSFEANLFSDPAFALPALRYLDLKRAVQVLLVWDVSSRDLIGVCMMVSRPWPLPVGAWLHAQATAAFPLLDRDRAEVAMEAIVAQRLLNGWPGGGALLLSGLPVSGATARLLPASATWRISVVEERRRAVLRPTGTMPKPSKETRRQQRRLGEIGPVAFGVAITTDRIEAETERFAALESGGWKGRRGTAFGKVEALLAFLREVTSGLSEAGQCRIETLAVRGAPIAMAIILRSGDRAYFWKTAYDESFRRWSPGVQLTHRLSITQAAEPSLEWTDSCAIPNHAMIDRLWPDRMTVLDMLVAPPDCITALRRAVMIEQTSRRAVSFGKRLFSGMRR